MIVNHSENVVYSTNTHTQVLTLIQDREASRHSRKPKNRFGWYQNHRAPFPLSILDCSSYQLYTSPYGGRDSSVGIATCYRVDGPGIESGWGGRDFPHLFRPARPASYTMGTGSFPGVKRPGRGFQHPTPSSAEVKERVELYLYSPSGPTWPVLRWTLPLLLP